MSKSEGTIQDILKEAIALSDDDFAVYCECLNDSRLPTGYTAQFIEKVNYDRKLIFGQIANNYTK